MANFGFHPVQTHSLHELNRKYKEFEKRVIRSNNNNNKNKNNNSQKPSTFKAVVSQFARETTIHGINHLFRNDSSNCERCVWFLTVFMAFFGSIYVGLILYHQYSDARIQTVLDNPQLPIYNIVFPEVIICNANSLNWSRIEEAKKKFLPAHSSLEIIEMFERIIMLYDDFQFAHLYKFGILESEPLQLLQHVNFSLVYEFMTWRCEEMLTLCEWQSLYANCCEIFSLRRSQHGLCWAFNTLSTEQGLEMQRRDPLWPFHTGSAGSRSGLTVRVLINAENHVPQRKNDKGITAIVLQPTVWHSSAFFIAENTYTTIQLNPVLYFHGNETRSLTYEQRKCIFEHENIEGKYSTLHGVVYMFENCLAQCRQEHLVRLCNCTMELLFPPEKLRSDHHPAAVKFVRQHYEGIICKCLHNCHSLNYDADIRPLYLSAETRKNISYVDLDVHYRFETMVVLRTNLIFDWVDLLVALGGIAGLFLGCSLISFIELAYFMLIELSYYVFAKLKHIFYSHLKNTTTSLIKLKGKHKGTIIQVKSQHNFYSANKKAVNTHCYPSIHNKLSKI